MTGTAWTVTREQLIDALANITADVPLTGPDAGKVNAESLADAVLAQLPAVTSVIGVSALTGEPLTISPEAEAAMADAGLAVVSRAVDGEIARLTERAERAETSRDEECERVMRWAGIFAEIRDYAEAPATHEQARDALREILGRRPGYGLVTVSRDDLRRILAAVYGFALPGAEDDAFARLAEAAGVPSRDDPLSLTGFLQAVETANDWLDGDVSSEYRAQPLAHTWARVTKVSSEAGEVMDALSKMTGENPRKGVCGTKDDLLAELGDTASAAILAIQHLTGDTAETWEVVSAAVAKVRERAERAAVTP